MNVAQMVIIHHIHEYFGRPFHLHLICKDYKETYNSDLRDDYNTYYSRIKDSINIPKFPPKVMYEDYVERRKNDTKL